MSGKRSYRTCVICGIKEAHLENRMFFANFPLDENRCREWVRATGNSDLVYLPLEKLHTNRFICENHFKQKDFNKKRNRLKKRAVPCINLMSAPLSDTEMAEFPLHISKHEGPVPSTSQQSQDVAAVEQIIEKTDDTKGPVPSTSQQSQDVAAADHTITLTDDTKGPVPSTSQQSQDVAAADHTITQTDDTKGIKHDLKKKGRVDDHTYCKLNDDEAVTPDVHMKKETVIATRKFTSRKRPLEPSVTSNLNESKDTVTSPPKKVVRTSENATVAKKLSRTDLNTREAELLQQLGKAKSTIRSLKRTAKQIDSVQSTFLKDILEMALKNQKRKPRGRRWTTKYKISLLSIFKRSPKAYRYLKHLMPLPSINTLQNILHKIPLEPGISKHALEYLKKHISKAADNKHCCLLFDEIALKPRLVYNNNSDKVEGFTDMGNNERTKELADHALVFMLQGLKKKIKQPIAFYFVKGTVASHKLASLIKEIIEALTATGCNIIATVCDQGPTNMGALNILQKLSTQSAHGSEEIRNSFEISGKKVFIVYDVPHLMKSIRNNFLNYGTMTMDGKVAKWQHLKKVEEKNRGLLYLSKISPIHVQPKYRAKMKVKYAVQIMSNTVAAVLKLLSLSEKDAKEAEEIMQSGMIIQSLDKLFDFCNGPSGPNDIKKGLRENVSQKTDHLKVWAEYKKKMDTVAFVKNGTGTKAKNVRCIKGFKTTLCSLRDIWLECQRLGFRYLNLRQLNQDALENLFGILRQHSPTDRNPTVSSFIGAMKSTIISKFTAPHSRGANCEKDSNILLADFHEIVFGKEGDTIEQEKENLKTEYIEENESFPVITIPEEEEEDEEINFEMDVEEQPMIYISGYLAYTILKKHKCVLCEQSLTTTNADDDTSGMFQYIKLREWWKDRKSLTYPKKELCRVVETCIKIFQNQYMDAIHPSNIRDCIVTSFLANCDNRFVICSEHQSFVINLIVTRLAVLLIRRQTKRISKKISLQEEGLADQIKKAQQKGLDKS